MAPDAVVRLVERADEVGAVVGEREAVALAQVIQDVGRNTVAVFGVHRDQPHEVELVRRLEQHAGAVLRLALRRERRPRGVARGVLELPRVRRLVLQPLGDLAREVELGREPGPVGSPSTSSGFTLCIARRCTNRRFTE